MMDLNELYKWTISALQSVTASNITTIVFWTVVAFITVLFTVIIPKLFKSKKEFLKDEHNLEFLNNKQDNTESSIKLQSGNLVKGDRNANYGNSQNSGKLQDVTNPLKSTINQVMENGSVINNYEDDKSFINVPQRNNLFSGREDILNSLFKNSQVQIITQAQTIHDLGGVGKTSIAIEYAYRNKDLYNAVLWINAESFASLSKSYIDIAQAFGLDTLGVKPEALILAVNQALFNFDPNEKCLIIFDNAKDRQSIEPYIPKGNGHVLITSRYHDWNGIACVKQIDVFKEEEALDFLKNNLDVNYDKYYSYINVMPQVLGCTPLALTQAVAYINNTTQNPSLYLEELKIKTSNNFSMNKPEGYPYTVATTWQVSVDKLKEIKPKSVYFLYIIAFLASNNINLAWFVTQDEFSEFMIEVIEPLEKCSLITRQGLFISIHKLVQMVIRDSITDEAIQKEQIEEVINIMSQIYHFDLHNQETWEETSLFIPHIESLMDYMEKFDIKTEQAGYILHTTGCYYDNQGNIEESLKFYFKALEITEKVLGVNHSFTATSYNNIGAIYDNQGYYDEALEFYFKALKITEKISGVNHPDSAYSYNNIGLIYKTQGNYDEAHKLYNKAYEIFKSTLGDNHPNTLTVKENMESLKQTV